MPAPIAIGLVTLVLLPWWSPKMRPYGIFVLVVVTAWFFTTWDLPLPRCHPPDVVPRVGLECGVDAAAFRRHS